MRSREIHQIVIKWENVDPKSDPEKSKQSGPQKPSAGYKLRGLNYSRPLSSCRTWCLLVRFLDPRLVGESDPVTKRSLKPHPKREPTRPSTSTSALRSFRPLSSSRTWVPVAKPQLVPWEIRQIATPSLSNRIFNQMNIVFWIIKQNWWNLPQDAVGLSEVILTKSKG